MKLEKITKEKIRRYEDGCATAHTLDLIGERWALLVMRELMLGSRRFGELRASLPGVSANVLTQRLEGLEAAGVLRRRKLPPPASVQVYELTEWGSEAEPIILWMGRWGARSPTQDTSFPLSPISTMLSFKAMFDPARAGDIEPTLRFRMGEDVFRMQVKRGQLSIERGEGEAADVEIAGRPEAIIRAVYGLLPLEEAEREGALSISGNRDVFLRFADIFELPPRACLKEQEAGR